MGVAAVCSHWGLRVASVNSVDLGFLFGCVYIFACLACSWLLMSCCDLV